MSRWLFPLLLIVPSPAAPQQAAHHPLRTVTVAGDNVVVKTDNPRPLFQAIVALRGHYKWLIDYEDPVYTANELVDATDSAWRAAHPQSPGVRRIAGGIFTATLQKPLSNDDEDRLSFLRKLGSQYSTSGNPGTFKVIQEGPGRFLVKPDSSSGASSPLDMSIPLPAVHGNCYTALTNLFAVQFAYTHTKVGFGLVPNNLLIQTQVTLPAQTASVNDEILSIVKSITKVPLTWDALYDADLGEYIVGISPLPIDQP